MLAVVLQSPALACVTVVEVAITPERRAMYQQRLERAHRDLKTAQQALGGIKLRLENDPKVDAASRYELNKKAAEREMDVRISAAAIRENEATLKKGVEYVRAAPTSTIAQKPADARTPAKASNCG